MLRRISNSPVYNRKTTNLYNKAAVSTESAALFQENGFHVPVSGRSCATTGRKMAPVPGSGGMSGNQLWELFL